MNNSTSYDKIIDFHVHTFPDKIAANAISQLAAISGIIPSTDGTVDATIRLMKECGITGAAILNIATSPKQQTTVNNTAAKITSEYKNFLFPFGSVHFEAENALDELDRIKELGLKGVKLHPDYQGFMIDDSRLFPIYDRCAELSLPIVFHAGYDCYSPDLIHAPPTLSVKVLKKFPRLKMVLAHFGGLNQWNEVEAELIGKDVWLDTAMCATYGDLTQIKKLILKHDSSRILFGSDCPWENPRNSLEFIIKMKLGDELTTKILYNNANMLLQK